jgi:hypothetical protein
LASTDIGHLFGRVLSMANCLATALFGDLFDERSRMKEIEHPDHDN